MKTTSNALSKLPMIWMNVTTTANWNRPAVGVVRVEQSLCAALEAILPAARFKKCVWRDHKFVEYFSKMEDETSQLGCAVNALLPDTPGMESARAILRRALEQMALEQTVDEDGDDLLSVSFPLLSAPPVAEYGPVSGDVVVTVGLDWDQPYSHEFFSLRKKGGLKIITCCYDLIPMLFPQYCVGDVARHFKDYFTRLIWGSAGILCISEQTKRDLARFCQSIGAPERPMLVVRLGDSLPGEACDVSDSIKALAASPFLLFVSTIERRKNHEVLYRAYHHLCATGHRDKLPKMVFVGMHGWGVGELIKDIELDPLTLGLIVQLNHVSDAELNYLYEHTHFCVYPSLYEGWGLPVAEALVYGKAILSSDQGSLPEVGGELVKYLPPWDTYAWAASILEWVEQPAKVQALEKTVQENYIRHDWSGAAAATVNLINEIVAQDAAQPMVILPGYECSTNVGTHLGPCLRSNGKKGHMMFGPFWSLAAGLYQVDIFDTPAQRMRSKVLFDVVHGDELETLAGKHLNITEAACINPASSANHDNQPLTSFVLSVPRPVSRFQIRCFLFEGSIEISKVVIQRTGDVAPGQFARGVAPQQKIPSRRAASGI